jgi:hypothetical protein
MTSKIFKSVQSPCLSRLIMKIIRRWSRRRANCPVVEKQNQELVIAESRLPDSHNADGLITITWSTSTFEYYETASMFHSKPCLCPFAECKRFIEYSVPDAFDSVHEEKCSTAADKLLAGVHENGATAEL